MIYMQKKKIVHLIVFTVKIRIFISESKNFLFSSLIVLIKIRNIFEVIAIVDLKMKKNQN